MMRVISSEWLRTRHTAVRWMVFCMPVVFSAIVTAYLVFHKGTGQAFIFEGFFTVYAAFLIPVAAGILAGFLVQEEELAGHFNGFLGRDVSRGRLYLGKFIMLAFCMMICVILSILVLCAGLLAVLPGKVDMFPFAAAAALMFLGTLPLLAMYLWAAFVWGFGAAAGISMAGILMAVLFGTFSMGGRIWLLIPWTWPVKLAMLSGGSYMIKIKMPEELSEAILATMAGLILFLAGGMVWFCQWEGRKTYE